MAGHQEARPTGAGPGSGTRLLRGGGTGLLIGLPAVRERKHPYAGRPEYPRKGPRGDGRVRGPLREVIRLDGVGPASAPARARRSAGAADVPGEKVAGGAVQVAAAAVVAPGGARGGVPHGV